MKNVPSLLWKKQMDLLASPVSFPTRTAVTTLAPPCVGVWLHGSAHRTPHLAVTTYLGDAGCAQFCSVVVNVVSVPSGMNDHHCFGADCVPLPRVFRLTFVFVAAEMFGAWACSTMSSECILPFIVSTTKPLV